jgi:transcriptional regulator GlxA family with amidase domain
MIGLEMTDFNIVLFDDFETLDAFGPAEIIGKMPKTYHLGYYSSHGGTIVSSQQIRVETAPFSAMNESGVLLIPGGMGTRNLVNDTAFVSKLMRLAANASYVLTVCTGSALLSRTELLNGHQATSNKRAFDWVCSVNESVSWVKQARWVVDGHFYTSSGVSAGMDMTLGFISDLHGDTIARNVADSIEYIWNADRNLDPFAY